MRLCAGLTSAKLTPFPRSSTTGRTTDSKYLFGAKFSLHGNKITPNRLRGWSILNSFGNCCIDELALSATVLSFTAASPLYEPILNPGDFHGCGAGS